MWHRGYRRLSLDDAAHWNLLNTAPYIWMGWMGWVGLDLWRHLFYEHRSAVLIMLSNAENHEFAGRVIVLLINMTQLVWKHFHSADCCCSSKNLYQNERRRLCETVDQRSPQCLPFLLLLLDTFYVFLFWLVIIETKDDFQSLSLTNIVEAGVFGCGAQYSLAHLPFPLPSIMFAPCFHQLLVWSAN